MPLSLSWKDRHVIIRDLLLSAQPAYTADPAKPQSWSSEWPSSESLQKQMLARMQRKGDPGTLLVGMLTGAATMENSMEASQKTKNRTAI